MAARPATPLPSIRLADPTARRGGRRLTRPGAGRGATCALALALASTSTEAQQAASATRSDSGAARTSVSVRNRTFLIPRAVVAGVTIQPTLRLDVAATPRLALALEGQTVDNSGPGRQGTYRASRTVPGAGSGNFLQEVALEGRWRVRGDATAGRALHAVATASLATRSYSAVDTATGAAFGGNRRRLVPTVAVQGSVHGARGLLRGALAAVFLPRDDALYLRRIPGERRRFGPLLGAELEGERVLTLRATLWGRGFVPLAGHNTIDRSSGAPARAVAYDAGLRWSLSPALALEGFVSNALGNTGALAAIADREYHAIGTGLRVHPGAADRAPPARAARGAAQRDAHDAVPPLALATLAPAGLARGHASLRARWGGQGLLAALDGAVVRQLEVGAFIDLLRGTRDEGELGALARVTLGESPHASVGLTLAASRTDNPLVNLLAARSDELQRLGLPRGGFRFGDESLDEGRLYTVTGAIAVERRMAPHTLLRTAPLIGYVQRHGLQIGGVAVGVEQGMGGAMRMLVESGVAVGRGNRLDLRRRSHAVPWLLGAAWMPRGAAVGLDAFVTNRAGDSPFHMLRLRSHGQLSAGVGVRGTWP